MPHVWHAVNLLTLTLTEMSDNIALASALTKDVLKIEGAAAVQIFNQPNEAFSTGLAVGVDPVLRFAYKIDGTAAAVYR